MTRGRLDDYGNLQKYQNPNPIQRYLLNHFLDSVAALASPLESQSVLDVGCAEGFALRRLQQREGWDKMIGVDVDGDALRWGQQRHPGICFCQGDAFSLPFPDQSFDLLLCLEVLEHLQSPQKALQEIERVTRGHALISVPHEPLFRLANLLRGKHLRRWGDDPGHLQHWGERGFRRLLGKRFRIQELRRPFPWLLALIERKG